MFNKSLQIVHEVFHFVGGDVLGFIGKEIATHTDGYHSGRKVVFNRFIEGGDLKQKDKNTTEILANVHQRI